MLAQYTPAETLMLVESEKTTLRLLLLLTFLDLRLKKVLEVAWLHQPTGKKGETAWGPYVQYGEMFLDYEPKPHENVFYEPLASCTEPVMPLGRLLEEARELAVSRMDYLENYFLKDAAFAKNFIAIGINIPLSAAGKREGKRLSDEIRLLNEQAPGVMNDSPQEAAEILLTVGGNMFLLNSVPYEKMEAFGEVIGRDRSLKYADNEWRFDKQKKANPFYDLQKISTLFYKEFEHPQSAA